MEQNLIVELCKIEDSCLENIVQALENRPDYGYVLGQLHMHRMAGAAYYVLRHHGLLGKLNREFRSSLWAVYQYNQLRNEAYANALSMLADILKDADFTYAVLKGSVLLSMYPSGIRTSNDVDLLVSRKDISKVVECFQAQGFVQGFIRNEKIVEASRREIINAQLNRGEIIPFVKRVGWQGLPFLEVDINVSLDEKASGDTEVIDVMLQERSSFMVNQEKNMYTLKSQDFLIHLCVHLYKEATIFQWVEMGRDLSVYKFLDIYLYYRSYAEEQWDKVLVKRIQDFKLEIPCYYALYYTGKLFDSAIFDGILKSIGEFNVYKDILNRVYNPVNKKWYSYSVDFMHRLFDADREQQLEEVTDGEVNIKRK